MKITFLFIIIFGVNLSFTQINRVVYKNGLYGKDINNLPSIKNANNNLDQESINRIKMMRLKNATVEFELLFDKDVALFRRIEKLDIGDEIQNDIEKKMYAIVSGDKYYKNSSKNEKIVNSSNSGINTNIIYPFDQFSWTITAENKLINGYKCFKATSTKIDVYNPFKKSTQSFLQTAWFCPDIPSSFGPKGLDGLPGLVLEASENGVKYIYAASIEFDIKGINSIEKPYSDKSITEKEFDIIIAESLKKQFEETGN